MRVSSSPARPTNGSPCASSSAPGASPTNTMPTAGRAHARAPPACACRHSPHRVQARASAAISASGASERASDPIARAQLRARAQVGRERRQRVGRSRAVSGVWRARAGDGLRRREHGNVSGTDLRDARRITARVRRGRSGNLRAANCARRSARASSSPPPAAACALELAAQRSARSRRLRRADRRRSSSSLHGVARRGAALPLGARGRGRERRTARQHVVEDRFGHLALGAARDSARRGARVDQRHAVGLAAERRRAAC